MYIIIVLNESAICDELQLNVERMMQDSSSTIE